MKIRYLLALGLLVLLGCATRQATTVPFLPMLGPTPAGAEEVYLTGMFAGELVIDRGCVRVRSASAGQTRTILWHRGTERGHDSAGYFLRDARIGKVVRFGTTFSFGGGEMPEEWVQRDYAEVARRCDPPYGSGWLPQ